MAKLIYWKTNALTKFQIVKGSFVNITTILSGKIVRKRVVTVNTSNKFIFGQSPNKIPCAKILFFLSSLYQCYGINQTRVDRDKPRNLEFGLRMTQLEGQLSQRLLKHFFDNCLHEHVGLIHVLPLADHLFLVEGVILSHFYSFGFIIRYILHA